eukprot:GHVS01097120.1.p1 GENE.GHVS01097120.1~~GHVS01097120.1.p1  ORF type:complete len:632 (-),score=88.95 GHVS01097120.1:1127-3022(-)
MSGKLQLTILSGKDLPPKDINGYADPYCKFYWKGKKYKTSVQKKTLNPKWNELFLMPFDAVQGPLTLHIEIWDYDSFGSNEYMATLDLDLRNLLTSTSPVECACPLKDCKGKLVLRIQLPSHSPAANQPSATCPPQRVGTAASLPSPQGSYDRPPPMHSSLQPPSQRIVQYGHEAAPQYGGSLYPDIGPPAPLCNSNPPLSSSYNPSPTASYKQPPVYTPPPAFNPTAPPPAVGDTNAAAMKEIKDILPQCTYGDIAEALRKSGQNKDAAVDYLLSSIISASAHGPPSTPPPSSLASPTFASYAQQPHPKSPPAAALAGGPVRHTGRKKALLIGINYFGSSCQLQGCISDVQRMKRLLVGLYGFPDDSHTMVCLTDDCSDTRYQPTRANIVMAMQWLVADARAGDALWFHFSGHGAQQRDQSGMEEDGYDETILPSDYKRAGQIVDDEINACIVQPLPVGVRMTSVMDCCHSGTGLDLSFSWNMKNSTWEEEDNPLHVVADIQLFSGCRDDQTSADVQTCGESGGAMTMAVVAALSERPYGHSYHSFIDNVTRNVRNRGHSQKPQLTASQRFDLNRPFNLNDAVPNQNVKLGRQIRRTKKRKSKMNMPSGNTMMAVGGGMLAGWLLGEMFD